MTYAFCWQKTDSRAGHRPGSRPRHILTGRRSALADSQAARRHQKRLTAYIDSPWLSARAALHWRGRAALLASRIACRAALGRSTHNAGGWKLTNGYIPSLFSLGDFLSSICVHIAAFQPFGGGSGGRTAGTGRAGLRRFLLLRRTGDCVGYRM